MNSPTPRESHLLSLIRQRGPLSRKELHEITDLRPNTIGEIAASMLERGLLREGDSASVGVGRPRQLLEIDPVRLHVTGIAFEPGKVTACRLNLHGQRVGEGREQSVGNPELLVAAGGELLRELIDERTLGVGLSTTGFVDPQARSILISSATNRESPTSLESVYDAVHGRPMVVENNMHARATYWLLNQDVEGGNDVSGQDILLIDLRDKAVGAALLVGGRPNRGCVIGANELGHMRLPVVTDDCFCGHKGCLEQIFSSAFLRRVTDDPQADLAERLSRASGMDPAAEKIAEYMSMGIANAINFIRPDRVVLAGPILVGSAFGKTLIDLVRKLLLRPLAERVKFDVWDQASVQPADAAAWLMLADIFRGGKLGEVQQTPAGEIEKTSESSESIPTQAGE